MIQGNSLSLRVPLRKTAANRERESKKEWKKWREIVSEGR